MDQRIGPTTPPVPAAGTDPAYIPGLTAPRPAEAGEEPAPEEAVPEEGAATERVTAEEPAAETSDGPTADAASAEGPGSGEAEDEAEEPEAVADSPVFEVSDRRSTITADGRGITFELDGERAEFRWAEIGAVEIDTPRFGRRFAVTVYTTNRRWFEADVEAPARKLLKEWTAELDAVLDVCFEDEDAKAKAKEADAEAEAKEAEGDKDAAEETREESAPDEADRETADADKAGPADADARD